MARARLADRPRTFQDLILRLQQYWAAQGCVLMQPYDLEVGAGTFHVATFLRAVGPEPWRAAYVQPSRRPTDGRYGDNPNRLQQLALVNRYRPSAGLTVHRRFVLPPFGPVTDDASRSTPASSSRAMTRSVSIASTDWASASRRRLMRPTSLACVVLSQRTTRRACLSRSILPAWLNTVSACGRN